MSGLTHFVTAEAIPHASHARSAEAMGCPQTSAFWDEAQRGFDGAKRIWSSPERGRDARDARRHPWRGEQSLDRLGHRQGGACGRGRTRVHLPGRGAGKAGAPARRRNSARKCSAIATSPTAATIDAVFAQAEKLWGAIDFVVHCIAFADKDQLTGRYIDTTEDNFTKSLAISCYSFTAIAQRAEKLMTNGGSMLTLTYYGAEKWMPHYNVMGVAKAALEASVRYLAADLGEKGIRVNAISAGPIKTLAASGIGDFRYILRWNEYNSPLRRSVTTEEVGESAVYLLSPMSRGVTGEILHVDAGYHSSGMKNPAAPDMSSSRTDVRGDVRRLRRRVPGRGSTTMRQSGEEPRSPYGRRRSAGRAPAGRRPSSRPRRSPARRSPRRSR